MRDYFAELYGSTPFDDDDESKERRVLPDGGSVRRPLLVMDPSPETDRRDRSHLLPRAQQRTTGLRR
jgi:hypothetical protein